MISLMEELLLLALEDDKGTIPSSVQTPLKYGLAAAGLSDLLLRDKLILGEKQRVAVTDGSPTGDDLLDEMLTKIQQSRKPKSMKDWVMRFGNGDIKRLRERLESRLVEAGTLREEEGHFLKVFPWHHYPTLNGAPEAGTREALRAVLLEDEDPTPHVAVLISLVIACKLVDKLFPKEERKRAEQRAKEIAKGESAGEAVSKAVAEVTAAMMAAVSAATFTTTTSS